MTCIETGFGRLASLRAFARTAAIALPLLLMGAGAEAAAEKRVALVIGNSAYQNVPALPNPRNDAQAIAAALQKVDFEVIDGVDLDKRAMDQALTRFSRLAQDADAALVFYAGHGLQFQGQNYLIPIDTKLDDEFGLQFETTRVEDVMNALERAKGVRILVLDACRNNPFAEKLSRSIARTRDIGPTQGLAKIEHTRGMIIAYATQASEVAADGAGHNSPFSGALVKELQEPDVEVGTLFRRVALDVNRETNGKQTPELSLSLVGEFYFKRGETDVEAFTRLKGSSDVAGLKDFTVRYPKSVFVEAAQARVEALERAARAQDDRRNQLREQLAKLEQDKKKAADELAAVESDRKISVEGADKAPAAKKDGGDAVPVQKQAALAPQAVKEDAVLEGGQTAPADKGVVVAIQQELKRVGCFAGGVDEKWTSPRTTKALRDFTKFASLPAPKLPTSEFLGTLKEQPGRICPLACGPREVAHDDICIAKVCADGERLDRAGHCIAHVIARPHAPPRVERAHVAPRRPARIAVERRFRAPPGFGPSGAAGTSEAPIEGHRSWH